MGIIVKYENETTIIKDMFLPFADNPNGLGRIYKYDSIDNSIVFDYLKLIKEKKAFGECWMYHNPENIEISLDKISHKINKIEKTKEGIVGEIEILDTQSGKLVKKILKENNYGYDINVRPRLTGKVHLDGTVTVNSIISFDIIYGFNDPFDSDNYKNKRYKLVNKGINI